MYVVRTRNPFQPFTLFTVRKNLPARAKSDTAGIYHFQDPRSNIQDPISKIQDPRSKNMILKPFSRLLALTYFVRDPNGHSRASRKQGNRTRRRIDYSSSIHYPYTARPPSDLSNKQHTHTTQSRRERDTYQNVATRIQHIHASPQKTAVFDSSSPRRAAWRPRAPPRTRVGSAARAVARLSTLALSEATIRPACCTATKRGRYRCR